MSLDHLIASRRVEDCLHLDAPATHALSTAEMLAWNATLPAHVKLVLSLDDSPRLRMERPLDPDEFVTHSTRIIFILSEVSPLFSISLYIIIQHFHLNLSYNSYLHHIILFTP